ncbi:GTPase activating-like protein [Zostera marina]|uniref:GTPase activating-like protein n=1 Tax=Zostera marina TaxID=29655 RepID=A0A0K9Q221_ZOSMR|nr:GTPase activating-like protein [Zostera marina]
MRGLLRSYTTSVSEAEASSSSAPQGILPSSVSSVSPWTPLRSLLIIASTHDSDRGSLKSPWSRRKRKHTLSRRHWKTLFTPDGKFLDGGVKFLKRVCSGGVEPSIRAEVWPFLLAVYDINSSEAERNAVNTQIRKEYKKLRGRCHQLTNPTNDNRRELNEVIGDSNMGFSFSNEFDESIFSEDGFSASRSFEDELDDDISPPLLEEEGESNMTDVNVSFESKCSFEESKGEKDVKDARIALLERNSSKVNRTAEDFVTWQRIMRLDALRASSEWTVYSPQQAAVSEDQARKRANAVGLKEYDNLDPCRLYHAGRLIAILESYALYDQEIGYCQGMSDLLSPIVAVMEKDHEAFWCFVGFMRRARHNFRLDEIGIQRQLDIVSKIIKAKDAHLYRHLEKLQAEDCFFVYRMVVVLFRRELTFEQTVSLWEITWADQAAIRAGFGKSSWSKMKMKAPPTDDLLLYAIAACVLQKRKLIIEKYNSMDEIVKECNNMTGHLDLWKLLDDAHDLVASLHDKVS